MIDFKKNNSDGDNGYKLVHFCEFDKYATAAYCAVHGVSEDLNLGDITKVDENSLDEFNAMCGGSPCFPYETVIAVKGGVGFMEIGKIKVGDYVLTDKYRYRKVLRTGGKPSAELWMVQPDFDEMPIKATADHPFLVVHKIDKGFSEPEWKELSKVIPNVDYLCMRNYNVTDECKSHRYVLVKRVFPLNKSARVYNLEVEEDNTYCAENAFVHNCQDFSVSGKQAGSKWQCQDCGHEYNPLTVHFSERDKCPKCGSTNLNKTRSSLLVEWLRVVRANKPNWCIYENVKNIVGKQFKETFDMFIDELHEYGYNTYWKVLNAKDYGIPQNRERVYLIAIKKELDNGLFKFPEGFDNGLRLKDMLEPEVDEKFFINSDKADTLIRDLIASGKLDKPVSNTVRTGGERKLRKTPMGSDFHSGSEQMTAILSDYGTNFNHESKVANTIMARDYKGFG